MQLAGRVVDIDQQHALRPAIFNHMWTPPDGKGVSDDMLQIECFHMSGLLMQCGAPLALMQSASLFPITSTGLLP